MVETGILQAVAARYEQQSRRKSFFQCMCSWRRCAVGRQRRLVWLCRIPFICTGGSSSESCRTLQASTSGAGLASLLRTTFRLVGLLGVPLTSSTAFLCHFSASLARRPPLLLHPLKFQPAPLQCALTFTPPHISLLALPRC